MSRPSPGESVSFCLYGDRMGGAESHTCALASVLAERGWSVAVIFLVGPERTLADTLRANGVRVISPGYRAAREALVRPHRLTIAASTTALPIIVLPSNGFLAVALRMGCYRGIVVAMEHGDALNRHLLSRPRRLWDRLDRRLGAALVDCEVSVSQTSADNLRTLPHASRVTVIHNGVDIRAFRVPSRDRQTRISTRRVTIGVAARLVAAKGLGTVWDACWAVAGECRGPEAWRVIVAGEGPNQRSLEAQIHALGLEEYVTFLGRLDNMPGFWRDVDVGIFPSDSWVESFGLSSVEALACGCRVLVSESAASREILGGCGAATFFPAGDAPGLARRLVESIRLGPPTEDERAQAHSWVAERYSIARAADEYATLFSALRAGARAGSADRPQTSR